MRFGVRQPALSSGRLRGGGDGADPDTDPETDPDPDPLELGEVDERRYRGFEACAKREIKSGGSGGRVSVGGLGGVGVDGGRFATTISASGFGTATDAAKAGEGDRAK